MLTDTERAYLAGFFEADGCVNIGVRQSKSHATPSHYLQVIIAQSNKPFLQRWRDKLDMGSIHKSSPTQLSTKDHWRWHLSDRQAEHVLNLILPYLDIKQDQAEIAIRFMETKGTGGRRRTPQHVLDLRDQYKQELHDAKGELNT